MDVPDMVEVNLNKLAEPAAVVVLKCLCIPKGFE
jgi:hypothetical protein